MKKPIKIVLVSVASLVVLAVAAAGVVSRLSDRKLHRIVQLPPLQVTFAPAEGQLERGEYLFKTRGCMDCHGVDGSGHVVVDEGGLFVRAPNITSGGASPTRSYTDTDWVRTLRHGVKPSGQPLLVMPSEDYARMTDADLGAIVAYVRSLPPASTGAAEIHEFPLPIKAAYALGAIKDAAEKIDHTAPPPQEVGDTLVARGQYVAQGCTGCHGPHFSGGKIPGTPPSWPPAANLTSAPDSAMSRYTTAEQFKTMLRSGKRPDGSAISEVMPFKALAFMNDAELDALYAFLKTLEPRPSGQR
ncbi:MAG TPA: cytochrome c [Steroidobacteraceae bacterium]|jgi:mono/diheme cytochrome c family protein